MSALSGGLLDPPSAGDDTAELRALVDELGRRSFEARLGQRGVPEKFDSELWRNLEETGLAQLTQRAGLGAGPVESAVVLYGVARHAGAVPIAETDLLAAWLGQRIGLELPSGPLTVAIADTDVARGRVKGVATDVPWTQACAAILLVVRTPTEVRIGILNPNDAKAQNGLRPGHNLAGEPRDRLTFDVVADRLHSVDPARGGRVDAPWRLGSLCTDRRRAGRRRCVVGRPCPQRVQFGRPLSKFQAVQHALAAMAGDIERARAATTLAIAAAAEHGFASAQTDFAVTAAKVAVGRVAGAVTTIAHQLHGAIGVTAEHPLWLATMRAQSWATDYGSTAHYARRLGRLALAAPDPWDVLIGNLTS